MGASGPGAAANGWGAAGWRERAGANTFSAYAHDPNGSLLARVGSADTLYPADDFSFYDAYGLLRGAVSVYTGRAVGQRDPAGFGGQWGGYTDPETGLALMTRRYYDGAAGRFVTRDPIGYGGGANLYGFTGNNPVNEMDPGGLDPDDNRSFGQRVHDWFFGRADSPLAHANHGVRGIYDIDGVEEQDHLDRRIGRGMAQGVKTGSGIYALAVLGAITGGEGPTAEAAVEERGFTLVANAGSEVRRVRLRPSTLNWGLTAQHIEKHLFGSGPLALKSIDAGGNGDVWAKYIADLLQSPVTSTTSNGMIDVVKTFPKTNSSGTFNLGVRLAPRGGGNYDLITILTRQ